MLYMTVSKVTGQTLAWRDALVTESHMTKKIHLILLDV